MFNTKYRSVSTVDDDTVVKSDIDVDIYGRGFDEVYGKGSEAVGRLETYERLRKKKYGIKNGAYVERDIYARGNNRIYSGNRSTAIIKTETSTCSNMKKADWKIHIRSGLMGKLAKLSRKKCLDREHDDSIEMERMSSNEGIEMMELKNHGRNYASCSSNTSKSDMLDSEELHARLASIDMEEKDDNRDNEWEEEERKIKRVNSSRSDDTDVMTSIHRGRLLQMVDTTAPKMLKRSNSFIDPL